MEKLKRYLVFLIGLFINSLGVSLITKADLGTSPISAVPYVLSLNFPMTLGEFTILFSLLLILIQLVILRKNFKPEHFLQIPISVLFGYFIDMTMALLGFVHPQAYPVKIVYLLIGCVILGFGVYLEVLANVAMLPGESFVRAVSFTWKTEFGMTKVAFDVSLTVLAGNPVLCLRGKTAGCPGGNDHCGSAGGIYRPSLWTPALLCETFFVFGREDGTGRRGGNGIGKQAGYRHRTAVRRRGPQAIRRTMSARGRRI